MKRQSDLSKRIVVAIGCFSVIMIGGRALAQELSAPGALVEPQTFQSEEELEIMMRGPVHEAFAGQVSVEPEPGLVVSRPPPEPIDEIPPEFKPEGDNVIWVSGYWGWDDEREDFIWVSGTWRAVPPDRDWVSGYWHEINGEYQWVSGFWASADAAEMQYLPQPPEPVETGPTVAAPSDDYSWIPGCWVYTETQYRWRPGFWHPIHDRWMWIPSHYAWTPRGYLYVSGYWDYRLPYRGHLYAPVHFGYPVWTRPGYAFTPRVTVDLGLLSLHLWARPRYRHYYFGDFYAAHYRPLGIYHWVDYGRGYRRYDPMLHYYSSFYRRQGIDYVSRVDGWRRYYERNESLRPPRRFDRQAEFVERHRGSPGVERAALGRRTDEMAADRTARMVRVDDQQRQRWRQEASESRRFSEQERRRVESVARRPDERRTEDVRHRDEAQETLRLPRRERREMVTDAPRRLETDRVRETADRRTERGQQTSRTDAQREWGDRQRSVQERAQQSPQPQPQGIQRGAPTGQQPDTAAQRQTRQRELGEAQRRVQERAQQSPQPQPQDIEPGAPSGQRPDTAAQRQTRQRELGEAQRRVQERAQQLTEPQPQGIQRGAPTGQRPDTTAQPQTRQRELGEAQRSVQERARQLPQPQQQRIERGRADQTPSVRAPDAGSQRQVIQRPQATSRTESVRTTPEASSRRAAEIARPQARSQQPQATPQPRQATPQPRQATPQPRQATPQPRQATPRPQATAPPRQQATPRPQAAPQPRAQGGRSSVSQATRSAPSARSGAPAGRGSGAASISRGRGGGRPDDDAGGRGRGGGRGR